LDRATAIKLGNFNRRWTQIYADEKGMMPKPLGRRYKTCRDRNQTSMVSSKSVFIPVHLRFIFSSSWSAIPRLIALWSAQGFPACRQEPHEVF
jgi:hypothetical protein